MAAAGALGVNEPAVAADSHAPILRFATSEITTAAASTNVSAPSVRFNLDHSLGPQAYRISQSADGAFTITAGDLTGAMYGGLDVAEAIRLGAEALARLAGPRLHRPFVAERGVKFNIPLDLRTPSYSDGSTSARANIPEVWSRDFWRGYFDQLARDRYNIVSLWSLHPFPSMVKVPEFPDVALNDVWRSKQPLGPGVFPITGVNAVPAEFLDNHEVVKWLSIDQKITFWREVMQMAADRGIDVYIFIWNVYTYGAAGKYGIDNSLSNPTTVAYFRASVRELLKTYPLLKGLGLTAGENMPKTPGVTASAWLWSTYGEGIRDALKAQPDRDFRLIHRFWLTSADEIRRNWGQLPGWPKTFSFSYKYSQAHMYSSVNPPFIEQIVPLLQDGLKTWLTVRNDDNYSMRWGDPDFVRQYILNMPPMEKLAGFYMGADGFTWGRDFLDRESEGLDHASKRPLTIEKHWYAFMLWGRLAYDPTLPDSLFEQTIASRFPGADSRKLYAAAAAASKIIPQTSRFFWQSNDFQWLPEACARCDYRLIPELTPVMRQALALGPEQDWPAIPGPAHLYTVVEFMYGVSMPGADILNIRQWRHSQMNGLKMDRMTPIDVADALSGSAEATLGLVAELRGDPKTVASKELRQTLGDYAAMAHLGAYYAEKIRAACDLALFDGTSDESHREAAIAHLQTAVAAWKAYALVRDGQYLPGFYCRIGWIDITAQTAATAADIDLARAWRPNSMKFDPNTAADRAIGMAYHEPVAVRGPSQPGAH